MNIGPRNQISHHELVIYSTLFILITRKVRLVEEQLAYGAVLILYYDRINSMNILKFFSSKEKYNSIITFTAL